MANKSAYKKGHVPWNKGIKYTPPGGSMDIMQKDYPIGTIRITMEGYKKVKIRNGKCGWEFYHREVWKNHHGEYPPDDMRVSFIDGNRQNCDISNLKLISIKELMARNSVNNLPDDLKNLIKLKGALTRKINEKEQH